MKPFRRHRRVLRIGVVAFLVVAVVAVGGVWWVHRHLARLTVEAVNRTFPDLELSAGKVALTGTGLLDLQAVRWRLRHGGATAVSLPSAQVRFSWSELQDHFIREVVIDQPGVRLTDAFLAAVGSASASANAPASGGVPWRIGRLLVKGGVARMEMAGRPTMRAAFAIEMAEGAPVRNQIQITSLHIRDPDGRADLLAIPMLKITASPIELQQGRIREILVEAPVLTVDDRILALVPKPAAPSSAPPAWSCDRLSIPRGTVKLALTDWPVTQCDFAIQAEHVAAEGGGAIELSLQALHAQWPGEAAENVAIGAVRVVGTLAGLARGVAQEIAIDDPVIHFTDGLRAWRPPATAGAAPALPSSAAPAAPRPWKADRFTVKRGQVAVDLAGAPRVDFGLHARLQNAGLGQESAEEVQSVEVLDFAMKTRVAGVEPFLRIPAMRAEFRLPELVQQKRLARLRIENLDFRYNRDFREMIMSGAKPAPGPMTSAMNASDGAPAAPATIGELRLVDGRVHLDDLGIGVPGIECRLETAFRELALERGGGQGGQELQTIELSQIALRSPLDPFVTVLDLDAVFIRFTLDGLWKREITEVAVVRPTLSIGPDLFWYIDRVQKNQSAPPAGEPAPVDDGPPWSIQEFSAKSGQLVLALEGQSRLALPMPFESRARNLNFRRWSDLRLKLQIDMPEQDYDYPGYELALRGVSGRIEFSLPPQKKNNNVVNTLRMKGVQWKNFRGRDLFLDVTYDERGIYGNLTGKGYAGIVRGQFNFLLTPESDWDGWISGSRIDLQPVTAALAPEKFSLSSPADFRLSVQARAREILKVDGDFQARSAGEMRIGKLDDFIRDLPGDWSGVKRGLSRISLETLRDFHYDTAHGDFHFTGLLGAVHLDLQGPGGSRKIEMNFREAPPVAKTGRVAANE